MSAGSIGSATTATSSSNTDAFANMSSSQFIQIITAELSNQDPFQPQDSSTLLNSVSDLRNIESQSEMQTSMSNLVLQDQIASGGNLIGKTVSGLNSNNTTVQGVVTGVSVANSAVSLQLASGDTVPIANVTAISAPSTGTTGN
jgi:flagellar basal-body rod modification protein FlgD